MENMTFKANLLPDNTGTQKELGSSTARWNIYGDLNGNATTATKLSNTPNNTTTYLRGDNSWQILISSGNSTLAWNNEITLATVGGTAIKAKLPANPNTDTLVKQTVKSDNVNYKLLMGANSSPTSGTAYEAVYDTAITVNPSTDTITATNFAGNATTASGVKDYNNSTITKFGYSTSGMTSASWLGSWDASTSGEYRLRAISPANAIKSGIGTTAIGSSTQPVYWTGAAFGAITSYEGNAATATTASKLGTANKGSSMQPIYLSSGAPTACTIPSSGAWWSAVPQILSDGVMEVGKYIDFHTTSNGTTDYDVRITAATTGLTISGTTVGTFSGQLTTSKIIGSGTAIYGTDLPSSGTVGQIFFMYVT